MQEINLNMYHAVALGALMFWLGDFLTAKISVLNRFCIPAPLVGGLCFAIVNTIMYALGIVVIAAALIYNKVKEGKFIGSAGGDPYAVGRFVPAAKDDKPLYTSINYATRLYEKGLLPQEPPASDREERDAAGGK